MSNAEKQRRYRARKFGNSASVTISRTKTAPAEIAALKAELAQAKAELVEAKARIAGLVQAFRDESKRRAAEPKAEKPPLPPDEERDRQIKSLKTRVKNLTLELNHAWHLTAQAAKRGGAPDLRTRKAIDKSLHPDRNLLAAEQREADRDNACKLWNAWKDDHDRAHGKKGRV